VAVLGQQDFQKNLIVGVNTAIGEQVGFIGGFFDILTSERTSRVNDAGRSKLVHQLPATTG
jgi:hypothetical protein